MARLNRLAWTAGLAFTAHGVCIGVRVTDASAMDDVVALLPTGWKYRKNPRVDHLVSLVVGDREPRRGLRRLHVVYSGAVRAFRTTDLAEALQFLEFHLEEYVAQMAPRRVFVHAGVVGWNGAAIVIPGASHSGKTSLVAALLEAGATYYSDEFAVLDEGGFVHPYPRPLRIRDQGDLGRRVTAEALGAASGRKRLPVALVASTRYDAAGSWRPRSLSQGEAVLELMSHTVPARFRPRQVLSVLKRVSLKASALKGRRGDARETARSLLAHIVERRSRR